MTTIDAEALAFVMLTTPRPIAEYHEDMGPVLWWKFPIEEPPYVGGPNDLGTPVQLLTPMGTYNVGVGGWVAGYYTHFTLIPIPKAPK